MNTYKKIKAILLEVKGGPMRQRSKRHLAQVTQARDPRRQARGFGAGPHDKPDAGEGTSSEVQVSIAKAQAALKRPSLTGIQRAQIQAYYNRITNKTTGVPGFRELLNSMQKHRGRPENQSTEINMNTYKRIYETLIRERSGEAAKYHVASREYQTAAERESGLDTESVKTTKRAREEWDEAKRNLVASLKRKGTLRSRRVPPGERPSLLDAPEERALRKKRGRKRSSIGRAGRALRTAISKLNRPTNKEQNSNKRSG